MLTYTNFTVEDIPKLIAWYEDKDSHYVEQPTADYIQYVNSEPNYYAWLVWDEERLIGYTAYEIEQEAASLMILIHPSYRKQGYGRELMKQLINRPEMNHLKQIKVGVEQANQASLAFFQDLGFQQVDKSSDKEFIDLVLTP